VGSGDLHQIHFINSHFTITPRSFFSAVEKKNMFYIDQKRFRVLSSSDLRFSDRASQNSELLARLAGVLSGCPTLQSAVGAGTYVKGNEALHLVLYQGSEWRHHHRYP
jgi:hypothetical protein